jgi:hypothetical protein
MCQLQLLVRSRERKLLLTSCHRASSMLLHYFGSDRKLKALCLIQKLLCFDSLRLPSIEKSDHCGVSLTSSLARSDKEFCCAWYFDGRARLVFFVPKKGLQSVCCFFISSHLELAAFDQAESFQWKCFAFNPKTNAVIVKVTVLFLVLPSIMPPSST